LFFKIEVLPIPIINPSSLIADAKIEKYLNIDLKIRKTML
jgi:hypothetical protein